MKRIDTSNCLWFANFELDQTRKFVQRKIGNQILNLNHALSK